MTTAVDNALAAVPAVAGYEKSFTDFTVTLLQNVMNALVGSSISQMRAYADLVSELEKGLSAFKGARTSPDAVKIWLQSNAPETVANPSGALSQSSADVIKNLYAVKLPAIVLLSDLPQTPNVPKQYTLPADGGGNIPDMNKLFGVTLTGGTAGNAGQIGDPAAPINIINNTRTADANGNVTITLLDAVKTMLDSDAELSYTELNTLVQMGLLRIVVSNGHILTKVTFTLDTADSSERAATDVYSSRFSAGGGGALSLGILNVAASASYSRLHVKVAAERTTTSTDILTTVMGEVKVDFRTDFFPTLPSQAKP